VTTSCCCRVALARAGELEVTTFCGNLGGCTLLVQPQDVVGILFGLGNWRVALARTGELEVVAFSDNLWMGIGKTVPRITWVFLPAQHADHVVDAGLTVRLGSTWMVRRHGEGGGSSSPSLMTASSSAGGRWWIAILLALRSREASSRELSMAFEAICLQDGRFSIRRFLDSGLIRSCGSIGETKSLFLSFFDFFQSYQWISAVPKSLSSVVLGFLAPAGPKPSTHGNQRQNPFYLEIHCGAVKVGKKSKKPGYDTPQWIECA
jgi:hypothetical protein